MLFLGVALLEPQRDGESPFAYLDRLAGEQKRVKLAIQAVRGGSFKGQKPNGNWFLEYRADGTPREVVKASPVELIKTAATLRCHSCGCPTEYHSRRELADDERKFKKHKDRKRCIGSSQDGTPCGCCKTPEAIQAAQGTDEWVAKKLSARIAQIDKDEAEEVTAENLYMGVREG